MTDSPVPDPDEPGVPEEILEVLRELTGGRDIPPAMLQQLSAFGLADADPAQLRMMAGQLRAMFGGGTPGMPVGFAPGGDGPFEGAPGSGVDGRVAAAGLDVFADEPHVPEALLGRDDVVVLPHVGSATEETRAAMADLAGGGGPIRRQAEAVSELVHSPRTVVHLVTLLESLPVQETLEAMIRAFVGLAAGAPNVYRFCDQAVGRFDPGEQGGFFSEVADRVVFMSDGQIVETATPEEFFTNPRSDRAKDFLGKILNH